MKLKKLTLWKRISVWWREGIWLEPLDWKIDDDGIIFYEGIDAGEDISVWALDTRGLIKLSKDKKSFLYFFKETENAYYFFGTEGIFLKKRNEAVKNIYSEKDFKAICVFSKLGIVCLLRDNNPDVVFKLTNGNIIKILEARIRCVNSKHVGCWAWIFDEEEEINMITQEGVNCYVYHRICEDGMYQNLSSNSDFMELFHEVM